MTFDPDDPRLTAFALGELDDDDREAVDALLARSAEARRFVDEIRETATLLSETLRGEPSPGLSIVQRIDLDARLGGGTRRRGIRRGLVAVAASIVLALGGYGVGWLTAPGARAGRAGAIGDFAMLAPAAEATAEAATPASGSAPKASDAEFEGEALRGATAAEPEAAREERSAIVADAAQAGPPAEPPADRAPSGRSMFAAGRGEDEGAPPLAPASPIAQGYAPAAPRPQPSTSGESMSLADKPDEATDAALMLGMPADAPASPPEPSQAGATLEPQSGQGQAPSQDGQAQGQSASRSGQGQGPSQGGQGQGQAPSRDNQGRGQAPAVASRSQPERAGGMAGAAMAGEPLRQRRAAASLPESVVADQDALDVASPDPAALTAMGGLGGAAQRLGEQEVAGDRPGSGARGGAVTLGNTKMAKVEAGNVVEVIDLPGGEIAQRLFFQAPVQDVVFDRSGTQLLATAADRSLSLFDVNSGRLLNELQVVEGPLPVARFGRPGEVILSDIGPESARGGFAADRAWSRPEDEPVAAIPVDLEAMSLDELGAWLLPGRGDAAGGREVPVARIVNAPPYPVERPGEGEAAAVDVRVVQSPWDDRHRLVRVALAARAAGDGDGVEPPPVVAEEVAAEVEFNPSRVLAYRPIGFEGRPSSATDPGAEGNVLRAGASTTVLFEIEPEGDAQAIARDVRSYRYQAVSPPAGPAASGELLTVTLSYREPGGDGRRTVQRHVTDALVPVAEAPDDVRLAAAMAWLGLGLGLGGPTEERAVALDGAAGLVRSCGEGFLPEYRRELLGLIDRARSGVQGGNPGEPD